MDLLKKHSVFDQELMETALEFMKLEKVELGGIKGRVLSEQVVGIFGEFQERYTLFTQRTYDSLDPNSHVSAYSINFSLQFI